MSERCEYARKRVEKLRAAIRRAEEKKTRSSLTDAEVKQLRSDKQSLSRWLKEFPDLDF
jgi:hypothetical protein